MRHIAILGSASVDQDECCSLPRSSHPHCVPDIGRLSLAGSHTRCRVCSAVRGGCPATIQIHVGRHACVSVVRRGGRAACATAVRRRCSFVARLCESTDPPTQIHPPTCASLPRLIARPAWVRTLCGCYTRAADSARVAPVASYRAPRRTTTRKGSGGARPS
eukprot:5198931-Prymnesium_polylepis.2